MHRYTSASPANVQTNVSCQAMPHQRAVFSAVTIADLRRGILWTLVGVLSGAAVLMQKQAGWTPAVAALLQCMILASIIREIERRPITSIRWWTRFAAAVRRRSTLVTASILLIVATAVSHAATWLDGAQQHSAGRLVWVSIELAASAAIGFFATMRRGSRITEELASAVSLFLALLCFNLLIGTLVSSTRAARALAPQLLGDNATRLSLIILISTAVTLVSTWAVGPSVLAAARKPEAITGPSRWLDGIFLILFTLLTVYWARRLD
jgi:hypothetical protein